MRRNVTCMNDTTGVMGWMQCLYCVSIDMGHHLQGGYLVACNSTRVGRACMHLHAITRMLPWRSKTCYHHSSASHASVCITAQKTPQPTSRCHGTLRQASSPAVTDHKSPIDAGKLPQEVPWLAGQLHCNLLIPT
jgi:hypothetical protein